jgi:hypothetical protein
VYETDAPPWPLAVATETQSALLLTDHVQSRVVSIVSVPVPPPSENVDDEALTRNWHFCVDDGATSVDVCVAVHEVRSVMTIAAAAAAALTVQTRIWKRCVRGAYRWPARSR